jgi:hypothetical protein
LNCYWGNNRYGGQFTYDQYVGSHDSAPPTWQGVFEYEFPPLLPRDSEGAVMDWHNCAYRFHLEGSSRITDGVSYLNWGSDDVYQSVVIAGATTTVTPTPVVTSTPTPTPTVVPPTPTPTATQGGGFLTDILPYFPLPEPFVILEPLINEDLSIHGIEVTQGIQCFNAGAGLAGCPDNSLPLVINKSTVARVYMDYSNIFPFITQRDDVQVRLYLRWNDDDFVSALASGRARATIDQSNAANSGNVYFYISSSANSGTLDLYAEVDPSDLVSESNESNNRFPSAGFVSIDFFKRDTLKIVGRRVRYHPAGYSGDQYAGGWAVNGGGATWLNQLLPIKNSGINYSNASGNLDWTSSLSGSTNQHTLISYLNTVWLLENIFSFFFTGSFTGADHVYGWTPDDGFSGGHADMPVYPHAGGLGVVAIGTDNPGTSTDNPGSGALIFGHELVHDYDVYHTNTGADDCGSDDSNSDFPYATSSIQEFGFNAATGMVYNPANTHDLMSYCPSGGSKLGWISPFTWNKMFNNLSAKKFAEKTLSPLEDPSPGVLYKTLAEQSLVLNVSIQNPDYNAGAIGGELGELYLIDAGATVVLPTGEYAIELRMDNVPLSRRDFVVSFKSEDEGDPDFPTMDASFAIPWEAGTDTVVLLHQDEVLDQREISPNKPTVTITSPSGAAAWVSGVTETLAWQGEDLDGDSMSYTVLFGRDGGSSWQLLVTGLTESSLNVEVDALAGTEDGRFQVVATDGVNIGMDETDGPISIPTKDPEAVIVDPQEGMRFSPGALVVLQGIGTDLEDGLLPDEALQWSSDLQGDLGVGPIVPINTLTSGEHLITLRVTDSDGQEGIGAVSIVINTPESFKVDLNLDGLINHEDILELLERVGESIEDGFPPTKADLDRNGRVDSDDLIEMSRFYQSAQ